MTPKHRCDILLIDGFSLLFRAYYGYPSSLTTPTGDPINAVYGFLTLMLSAINQFSPTHVGICMDRKDPTFRSALFPAYKANRSAPDAEFLAQLPTFTEAMQAFNIPLIDCPGYESDDILGTLSRQFSVGNKHTFVLSSDRDLLQIIGPNTAIVMSKKGVSDYVIYNEQQLHDSFGLSPHQIIDFKALKGDPSDNIPGVKGIGDKTALSLLREFQSLDRIYHHIDTIASPSVQKKLHDAKEMAYLSKQLVTIDCAVPVTVRLSDLLFDPPWYAVKTMCQTYGFNRLIHQLSAHMPSDSEDASLPTTTPLATTPDAVSPTVEPSVAHITTLADLNHLLAVLANGFACHIQTTTAQMIAPPIVAIGITASFGVSFVVDCSDTIHTPGLETTPHPLLTALAPLLTDPAIPKWVHNAKHTDHALRRYGIHIHGINGDTMITSHVLYPSDANTLHAMARTHLDLELPDATTEWTPASDILTVAYYSHAIWRIHRHLDSQLNPALRGLLDSIELPLVAVLTNMEWHGVACDTHYLRDLSRDYNRIADDELSAIYAIAGHTNFNVQSTQQLAQVLFDELGLPVIKKTKTGRSTDSSVLEKLANNFAIAKHILQYRTYKKLLSTYIDQLPELVNPTTGAIHTSFNQTITATGRLSSTHPNLQNIPVRTPQGQKIRQAFVSRFPNGAILSVDYSQIELRVLAHLSNDAAMIAAFENGHDIHQATASIVFQVPYANVTKPQREQAKTVNFGITYGQSAFALADQLRISRSDAQALINAYFKQFASIRAFMDETVHFARTHGFVETMGGRQRPIPDITTSNRAKQGNAERIAINTRVQGSAADIIKLAMVRVASCIRDYKSLMIMQVHDELVFDMHPDDHTRLTPRICHEMVSAMPLRIPLHVDWELNPSWGG